jgi:hypothetical protein
MAFDFPASPTSGQVFGNYTWDGEKWVQTLAAPNQSGVIAIKVFTASGTYVPSANMTTCVIECVGGGGGGGGVAGTSGQDYGGGGGGSGGYSRALATAAMIGASQVVTIGAFGAGGLGTPTNGSSGGDTSVGVLCIAKGGSGGGAASNTVAGLSGGAGGVAGTGDVAVVGNPGGGGLYNSVNAGIVTPAGNGGSSLLGGGAPGVFVSGAAPGVNATGKGGGGSGGGQFNNAATSVGGNGSAGLVIITEYGMTALGSAANAAGAVRFDLPQGLTAAQQKQARANIAVNDGNIVINGDFRVNQMGYVSAAALAAGIYGHDQWKAGAAGGDYSFTQLKSSTQITIAAGKSLIQPIEDASVAGGSYVLSWTGTAQARAGVNTLTPSGAYAASPLLITGQTAGTVMSVEFNAGTLGTVKLESGALATPFVMRPFDQELLTCQRYWESTFPYGTPPASSTAASGYLVGTVLSATVNINMVQWIFKVTKRTTPTMTTYNPFAAGSGMSQSGSGNFSVVAYSLGDSFVALRDSAGGMVVNSSIAIHAKADARL